MDTKMLVALGAEFLDVKTATLHCDYKCVNEGYFYENPRLQSKFTEMDSPHHGCQGACLMYTSPQIVARILRNDTVSLQCEYEYVFQDCLFGKNIYHILYIQTVFLHCGSEDVQ